MKADFFSLVSIFGILFALNASAAPPSPPPVPAGVCTITPLGSINFGNYDVFSTIPADGSGAIQILCDQTQPHIVISIGPSQNSGGFNPRKMKHSLLSDFLAYDLYSDAGRTVTWGDGTGGSSTTTQKAFKNTPLVITIFGRIPAKQDVYVGSYSETVTVTITW
jgi:spore coat protein U domain-containing protein, fimbrial subunit CupE1/2/3/6